MYPVRYINPTDLPYENRDVESLQNNEIPSSCQLCVRESTFIMPRGGMSWKKLIFLQGPCWGYWQIFDTPQFLEFSIPPHNWESKEYNSEFSLIVDTICSSSRCLIYSSTCFSSTKIQTCCFFHLTIAKRDMAPSLKNRYTRRTCICANYWSHIWYFLERNWMMKLKWTIEIFHHSLYNSKLDIKIKHNTVLQTTRNCRKFNY